MGEVTLAVYDPAAKAARRAHIIKRTLIYGLLIFFTLIYIMPLAVVVLNTFRPLAEIAEHGLINFPRSWQLSAWGIAWSEYCINGVCEGMQRNFYNSLYMTIPATIISTLLGAMNGYILSKWRFRGSDILFTCMLFGVFVPSQLSLLPWAYVLGQLGLQNSITGLAMVHIVQGISFTTLFCRNFYVSIPDDIINAARIDGAGFWRIFRKIVLPISPPILIVSVIWQFTGIWNEFLFGVVLTSGQQQPITSALVAMASNLLDVRDFDVMSAGVLIGALPPLLVYFFGGKYFVRGLTQGAVK